MLQTLPRFAACLVCIPQSRPRCFESRPGELRRLHRGTRLQFVKGVETYFASLPPQMSSSPYLFAQGWMDFCLTHCSARIQKSTWKVKVPMNKCHDDMWTNFKQSEFGTVGILHVHGVGCSLMNFSRFSTANVTFLSAVFLI